MEREYKRLLRKGNNIEPSRKFQNLSYGSFILVILVGFAMAFTVLEKLFFGFDIDSDWFWFLAGIGLTVEGIISMRRQRRFDKKYKIIERGKVE